MVACVVDLEKAMKWWVWAGLGAGAVGLGAYWYYTTYMTGPTSTVVWAVESMSRWTANLSPAARARADALLAELRTQRGHLTPAQQVEFDELTRLAAGAHPVAGLGRLLS